MPDLTSPDNLLRWRHSPLVNEGAMDGRVGTGGRRWGNQWPIANANVVVAWNGGTATATTTSTGMYVVFNVPFNSAVTVSATDGTTGAAIGPNIRFTVANQDIPNINLFKTTNN